ARPRSPCAPCEQAVAERSKSSPRSRKTCESSLMGAGGVILRQGPAASGHLDAARHVAYGSADVAATMEAAALAYGLDFSPLEEHRVELQVAQEWQSHPGAQALLDLMASRALLSRLEALGRLRPLPNRGRRLILSPCRHAATL